MIPSTQPNPKSILKEIAKIQEMERGTISIIRKTPAGDFYNHQTWENGKNASRYVPRDEVAALQEAINGYHQFKELTEEYAQQIIQKTRAERVAHLKKKHPLKSSSPKTPKSSS